MGSLLFVPTCGMLGVRLLTEAIRRISIRRQQRIYDSGRSFVQPSVTRCIILEAAAGEHLRKKLTAADDLLGILVIL